MFVSVEPQTWLEYLSAAQCWELLASTPLGRVGVIVDSAPEVYPVNFAVDDESIVFRTDPGNKLRGFDRSPSVCFEADETDLDDNTGWSVLVKGRAVEVVDEIEIQGLAQLPLQLWIPAERAHWIRIVPREITGRRIGKDLTTDDG